MEKFITDGGLSITTVAFFYLAIFTILAIQTKIK